MPHTSPRAARRSPRPDRTAPTPAFRAPQSWLALLPLFLILAVGLLAYANSFNGVFVYDEQAAIADNPNIRSLGTSLSAGTDEGLAGRPVVSLSFALNYALAPAEGRDAFTPPPPGYPAGARALFYRNLWGYHALNLAIHLAAALLLFGIARRTLESPRLDRRMARAARPLALVIALLWVAHPLNTSSVTYVAQRVESLMGLFYLLTLYCAIRAAGGTPAQGLIAGGRPWVAAAIVSCALGMASKEVMVTAPLVVWLHDRLFLAGPRPNRRLLYGGLAATWVLLAALVWSNPRGASVGFGVGGWTPWSYLLTQAEVITHYLRLAFVPAPLVLDYDWPAAASIVQVLPQLLLLGVLFGLTAWGIVRRTPLAFAGACFFLILGPSSSLLPIATEVAAEHRMYLPLAAVMSVVVTTAFRWSRTRTLQLAGGLLAAVVVAAFGYLTHQRNDDYASDVRIWTDTATKRPGNARAQANLGAALVQEQRLAEAEAPLRAALSIKEDYPEAHASLGAVLSSQGRLDAGIQHLERAVELAPGYRDAYRNLGEARATVGRHVDAVRAFRRAVTLDAPDPQLLDRLAWLLATSPDDAARDGREAVTLAERASQMTGDSNPGILDTLAAAYAEVGRFDEATATAARALALAVRMGNAPLAAAIQQRERFYQGRQPYREPMQVPR